MDFMQDSPYTIFPIEQGDELLDAHNDIIATFDPATEPEIKRLIAAAPEMYGLLARMTAYAANELIRLRDLEPDFKKEREMAKAIIREYDELVKRIEGR